jgi:ubiquinone/menaquinone biosynthesis C-methylase UbiE
MPDAYSPSRYDADYFLRIDRWAQSRKYREELSELVTRMSVSHADLLLDVGCGTGEALRYVQEHCGCTVVGLDYPAKSHEFGPRGSRVRGSAELLPFADATFTKVMFIHAIGHVPDPMGAVREAWRVLRPSGTLGIITPNRRFVYAHRPLNRLGFIPYAPDPTVMHCFGRKELIRFLSDVRFVDISVSFFGPTPRFLMSNLETFRERLIAVARKPPA